MEKTTPPRSEALIGFLLNALYYLLEDLLRGESTAALSWSDDYPAWGEYDDLEADTPELTARTDLTAALADFRNREQTEEESAAKIREAFLALLREQGIPEDSGIWRQAEKNLRA